MRYLPGGPQEIANESMNSLSMVKYMITRPDMLPYIRTLWRGDITPFSSLLADKGLTSKGLYQGLDNKNWRITSSNVVQFAIEHSDTRKLRFKSYQGVTFTCDAYATEPGKNGSVVTIYLDGNWFSPKDVLELKDWKTYLYVVDEMLPQEIAGGVWAYKCKYVTKLNEAYINSALMNEGDEIGFVYTMFEHDYSKTGYEKYTFDGWGRAYMTVQRMKYSISGTAKAMSSGIRWTEHNGNKTFLTHAQDQMLRRWAKAGEHQLLFGQGTVSIEGDVIMHDLGGNEIMAGDGIANQGDGSLKIPYQKWTLGFLQSIMQQLQLRAGNDGLTEISFLCGQKAFYGFQNLMHEIGIKGFNNAEIEGSGSGKGINQTYTYYELGGVRIIPQWYKYFDNPDRPRNYDEGGVDKNSYSGIFISLGNANNGEKGVELIQLRPTKMGTVSGIDVGGDSMANSIDGSSHHIISQTGIVLRNLEGVAEIYKR